MKKQILFAILMLAMIGCLAIAPAQAQDTGKIGIFAGYSYGTSNFGLNANNCYTTWNCEAASIGMHGYAVAVSYNFNKNIGFEANFGGHNGGGFIYNQVATINNQGYQEKQTQDIYTYTFGPKLTLPVGNFSIFTHALVGAMHAHEADLATCSSVTGGPTCSSSYVNGVEMTNTGAGTGMAFKTGGGVDWNHGRWGIRILEVDFVHATVPTTISNSPYWSTPAYTPYLNTVTLGANNFEMSTGITFNFK